MSRSDPETTLLALFCPECAAKTHRTLAFVRDFTTYGCHSCNAIVPIKDRHELLHAHGLASTKPEGMQ